MQTDVPGEASEDFAGDFDLLTIQFQEQSGSINMISDKAVGGSQYPSKLN